MTIIRCRKCRKGFVDSTCLCQSQEVEDSSAPVCNIWHLDVNSLPESVLTSIEQAQWSLGKLRCQNCNARLGSFNFLSRVCCPCGQETTVQLNKNRVDLDQKPCIRVAQPRGVRDGVHTRELGSEKETGESRRASEEDDVSKSALCPSPMRDSVPETDGVQTEESSLPPVASPSMQQTEVFGSVRDQQPLPETIQTPAGAMMQPNNPATRQQVKRLKNRLLSLRRKLRRKEKWQHSQLEQEQGVSLTDSEEDEQKRDGFVCAVCLDVFLLPQCCQPCGHVFCEPCLRTLAKDRPGSTLCPLCRALITHTNCQQELDAKVKSIFPKVYNRRRQSFRRAPCARWPLPRSLKSFRPFWGYRREPDRSWLESLGLANVHEWLFDVGLVIVYVHTVNKILGFFVFSFLLYLFFSC